MNPAARKAPLFGTIEGKFRKTIRSCLGNSLGKIRQRVVCPSLPQHTV